MSKLVEGVKREAVEKVVRRGAREGSVKVVRVEVVPLAYVANGAVRVSVGAVGELGMEEMGEDGGEEEEGEAGEESGGDDGRFEGGDGVSASEDIGEGFKVESVDYEAYEPNVVGDEWILSETDLCGFCLFDALCWKAYARLFSVCYGRMWRSWHRMFILLLPSFLVH